MYRLLTGKPPERAVTRALASNDPYVPVSQASKVNCNPAVFAAIDRSLMMASAQRPATIAVFKQMLGWEDGWRPPIAALVPSISPSVAAEILAEVTTEPPFPLPAEPADPLPSLVPAQGEDGSSLVAPANPPNAVPPELPPDPENTPSLGPVVDVQAPQPPPAKSALVSYLVVILLISGILWALVLSNSAPPYTANTSTALSPLTPPVPAIRYLAYNNSDIDGGNLPDAPQLRGSDQSSCEAACTDRSGCVAYVYDKWQSLCYLKQALPDLRFDPSYNAFIRTEHQPPSSLDAPRIIQRLQQSLTGNIYSTTSAGSRQVCSDACGSDDACFGYQYVARQKSCMRYNEIDDVSAIDRSVQAGVKRQAAPR
jgi:hypothetical protein